MIWLILFAAFCVWLSKKETTRFTVMKMLQGFFKGIAFVLVSPATMTIVLFAVLYWGVTQ